MSSNKIKVSKNSKPEDNTGLMIFSDSKEEVIEYNRQKIIDSLIKETNMARSTAEQVASKVEQELFKHDYDTVPSSFIRELVHIELRRRGFSKKAEEYDNIIFPIYNIEQAILSNLGGKGGYLNINDMISSFVLKNFSFKSLFTPELKEAHLMGKIFIHGLDKPTSLYKGVLNVEALKKYGVHSNSVNIDFSPPNNLENYFRQLNFILPELKDLYNNSVSLIFFSIFTSPLYFDSGYNKDILHDFILDISYSLQNEDLNIEFDLFSNIPSFFTDTPVVGADDGLGDGRYKAKVSFASGKEYKASLLEKPIRGNKWQDRYINGLEEYFKQDVEKIELASYVDFSEENERFIIDFLDILSREDPRVVNQIRINFHIYDKIDISDVAWQKLIDCINNNVYINFIFSENKKLLCGCNSFLDFSGNNKDLLKQPELCHNSIVNKISINLPQCVYSLDPNNNDIVQEDIICNLKNIIKKSIDVHKRKNDYIKNLKLSSNNYIDFEHDNNNYDYSQCCIGLVGVEEFIQISKDLGFYKDKDVEDCILEILSLIYLEINIIKNEENIDLDIFIDECFDKNSKIHFCEADLRHYGDYARKYLKGDRRTNRLYYSDISYISDIYNDINKELEFKSILHSSIINRGSFYNIFIDNIDRDGLKRYISEVFNSKLNSVSLIKGEKSGDGDEDVFGFNGEQYSYKNEWHNVLKGEYDGRKLRNIISLEEDV